MIGRMEKKLTRLTARLEAMRQENEFTEVDLRRWTDELAMMTRDLTGSTSVYVREEPQGLITNIDVNIFSAAQRQGEMLISTVSQRFPTELRSVRGQPDRNHNFEAKTADARPTVCFISRLSSGTVRKQVRLLRNRKSSP